MYIFSQNNFFCRTKEVCDGTLNSDLIFECGRPLGFSFNPKTGELYIVDGVLGLFVVGPNGGPARRLASSAEGVTFRFLNGVDVDPTTENVFFTSSSTTYDIRYTSRQKQLCTYGSFLYISKSFKRFNFQTSGVFT